MTKSMVSTNFFMEFFKLVCNTKSLIFFRTEIIKRLRDLQDKNSRFSPVVGSDLVDQSKVPAELQCPMCKRLFTDVVVTPCCGDSYCDECNATSRLSHRRIEDSVKHLRWCFL